MLTNEQLKDDKKVAAKFNDWLETDDAEYKKVSTSYEEARQYFEHDQKPSDVPDEKEYIEENLVTDLVFRLMGQLIGGKFTPILKGGGALANAAKELFLDILEKNKFNELLIENLANYFYVEGVCCIKANFNPFKRSLYGMGFPEIFILRPGMFLLDSNSIDPYHADDLKRAHKISIPLVEAQERFPDQKHEIVASHEEERTSSTEDFVDLYELQFKRTVIKDGVEEDEFFMGKCINKTVMVKPEKQERFVVRSRYKRFTIIPVIHTPRLLTNKYPFGPVLRIKDTQDQLNISASVILDAVKASIKMPIATTGARIADEAAIKSELAKPDGFVNFEGANVKVHQIYAQPLVRPVVEWHQMSRHRFDEISGKFAPDRGEVSGDLSGKAISLLQYKGIEPEYVMRSHIEASLSELGNVLLEIIKDKMQSPFTITRKMDNKEQPISFNSFEGSGDNLSGLNLDEVDFKVEVNMNIAQQRDFDMNKAILMRNNGALALQDFEKIMYPDTWQEKLANVTKENKAMQMVEMLKEATPELLDATMSMIEGQMKQQLPAKGGSQ